jgi:hypothetical protein
LPWPTPGSYTSVGYQTFVNKLPFLSIVIAVVLLPLLTASDRSPRRGLQRALLAFLGFNLLFVVVARLAILR